MSGNRKFHKPVLKLRIIVIACLALPGCGVLRVLFLLLIVCSVTRLASYLAYRMKGANTHQVLVSHALMTLTRSLTKACLFELALVCEGAFFTQ